MSLKTKPGVRWEAIAPNDATVYDDPPRALWIGGVAGDISLVGEDGAIAVFKNVTGLLPMSPAIVRSTGTTVTDIVAIW